MATLAVAMGMAMLAGEPMTTLPRYRPSTSKDAKVPRKVRLDNRKKNKAAKKSRSKNRR